MDFSKFSDDNFDVKEWVNSALRIRDDRTPIDVSFIICDVWAYITVHVPLFLCMIHRLLYDVQLFGGTYMGDVLIEHRF